MSISRKNWSALSSLTRQWTLEDEEEVERERRRRVKSSSADPDQASGDSPPTGTGSTSETSPTLSSAEQIQVDFVEMLRVRDEKRRLRHVETLRRQKEEGEDEGAANGGGEARVELLGDLDESSSARATSEPRPPPNSSTSVPNRQAGSGESLREDPNPTPALNPRRKFVSSVSISLDKSSPASACTSPRSPLSPTSPRSPSPRGVQNGYTPETGENGATSGGTSEQTTRPPLARQSSRTLSFRMMKKKEEERSPLQRSASVRMATKKFESKADQHENEDGSASSFQRNSRQRISSRSIQEKMERLAQAAQKSEVTRSPDVAQRTLFLMEEVSRKRGLFEKDQQAASPTSPGVSRQEFRNFASGVSDRINRWLSRTNQTGSSHNSGDSRHVDISSKRSVFETSREK